MSAEFLAEYAGLLKALERNDKRDINVLSMLAEDNKDFSAGIVATIENHILNVRLRASRACNCCSMDFTDPLGVEAAVSCTGQAASPLRR